MDAKITFSEEEKSIEAIWSWYEDQQEAIRDFKNKLRNALLSSLKVQDKFLGLSMDNVEEYFLDSEKELDYLVSFDIISSTEALLRIDFLRKVYNKDKSDLGRAFRQIYKQKANWISLEEDIIETWKKIESSKKKYLSDFLGLLNYRHWIAHGRYWTPKLGMQYNVDVSYEISDKIFELVKAG